MLKKISGLARALYIVLAIVAGFVAMGMMNLPLVIVVLGLIAGISMTMDRYVPAAATALVLPIIGAALAHVPMVGAQLNVIAGNLQMGVAGSLASALAIVLYHFVIDGVMGLAGHDADGRVATAAAK